jgi:hypothetical protein
LQSYNKILDFFRQQPRYISWLIKGGFLFLFALLIWHQVFQRENFTAIKDAFFSELKGKHIAWLILTLIFLPFNWATETLKWLHLIRHNETISFWRAYKAVLAGVTFSLFTPNRVGEFGGRILFLKPENTMKGILSTIVGSWAQQIMLVSFGYIGFIYFLFALWKVDNLILLGIFFLALLFISLLFFVFLNLEIVVPIFKKIKWLYRFPKLIKGINTIRQYTKQELAKTLFWAFVRYSIYSLQYYWMLRFFGINVPILRGVSCIATIYLLQTSIPLPPVVSLIARGEIALQVWGLFGANPISILAATFTLWIINLIIPAFMGLIFILKANLLKSLGYEKIS